MSKMLVALAALALGTLGAGRADAFDCARMPGYNATLKCVPSQTATTLNGGLGLPQWSKCGCDWEVQFNAAMQKLNTAFAAVGQDGQILYNSQGAVGASPNLTQSNAARQLQVGQDSAGQGLNDGLFVAPCSPGFSSCGWFAPLNTSDPPFNPTGMWIYPVNAFNDAYYVENHLGQVHRLVPIIDPVIAGDCVQLSSSGNYLQDAGAPCSLSATTTSTTTVTTTTATTTTTAGGGTTTTTTLVPANWTGIAQWNLEESSGTRVQVAGTCPGSNCNLTGHGAPGNDTGNFRQGVAALLETGTQNVECTQSTCSALNRNLAISNVTYCAWIRPTTVSVTQAWIGNLPVGQACGGYTGFLDSSNHFNCEVFDCAGNNNIVTSSQSAVQNVFHYHCCSYAAATGTLTLYVDGVQDGTNTGTIGVSSTATRFAVGAEGDVRNEPFNGQIDEVAVFGNAITASSICRMASCHPRAFADRLCTCNPGSPTLYQTCATDADCRADANVTALCDTTSGLCQGRRHSMALGCAIAACNRATP